MALTTTPPGELGSVAPDFTLPGVDGKSWSLRGATGKKATLVIFMCNHCPYVQAVDDRINQLAKDYIPKGLQVFGINPNDAQKYPDDNFEAMKEKAQEKGYVFPYLHDESQEVAHAYGAVCTPDFFLYDAALKLKYRGRLDNNWKDARAVKRQDLRDAIEALLAGKTLSQEQMPSMGCSIKWK